jgi:hypothetical protein
MLSWIQVAEFVLSARPLVVGELSRTRAAC